ncbi:MAG: hypothetical protein Q6358_00315 [Candidatus Brocadiales bacterium]|uniref:hypothetical protein n=1 Tax=Candidatus Wunengus sp. YC60 TaxID=3367697 RepID=UPI0027139AFF|nr:hypothetical protein [Candidatus Brocadiales bacterium]
MEISVNLRPDKFNVIYYDYTGKQEKAGGGRMVNLWMDKDGSIGFEFRGELTRTKSDSVSNVKNCTTVEGVFNH